MFEPTKRGFERGSFRGTLRADAVVPSTLRPVFHRPVCRGQPSSLQTPRVPLKITNEIDFGPIWGPFKVPRQRCGPMGCALGHRSSSVRRTGTIYGRGDPLTCPALHLKCVQPHTPHNSRFRLHSGRGCFSQCEFQCPRCRVVPFTLFLPTLHLIRYHSPKIKHLRLCLDSCCFYS